MLSLLAAVIIAQLEVPQKYSIGKFDQSVSRVSIKLPITNKSEKTIVIKTVKGECGCLKKVTYPNYIESKKTEFVTCDFDLSSAKKLGFWSSNIAVIFSDQYEKKVEVASCVLSAEFKDAKSLIIVPEKARLVLRHGAQDFTEIEVYVPKPLIGAIKVEVVTPRNKKVLIEEVSIGEQHDRIKSKYFLYKKYKVMAKFNSLARGKYKELVSLKVTTDVGWFQDIPLEIINLD